MIQRDKYDVHARVDFICGDNSHTVSLFTATMRYLTVHRERRKTHDGECSFINFDRYTINRVSFFSTDKDPPSFTLYL